MTDNKMTVTLFSGSDLLGVAFVVLKLCEVIDWPWLWVLAPFWIPLAAGLALILVLGIVAIIARIVDCFT